MMSSALKTKQGRDEEQQEVSRFKPGAFVSLLPVKISIKTKIFEFLEPIPVSLRDSG